LQIVEVRILKGLRSGLRDRGGLAGWVGVGRLRRCRLGATLLI